MSATRTIKTVKVNVGAKKGYSRFVYRVVECNTNQNGYRSERGVKVLWESDYLYRPTTKTGKGKGPDAKREATQIAQQELLKALGV